MCASSHTSTADDVPLEDMNHSLSLTHTESELSISDQLKHCVVLVIEFSIHFKQRRKQPYSK